MPLTVRRSVTSSATFIWFLHAEPALCQRHISQSLWPYSNQNFWLLWVNFSLFPFYSPSPTSVAGVGVFRGVASGPSERSVVVVTLSRLFHQKSGVFAWGGARGRGWSGRVNVPGRCGVHPGQDEHLLTGSTHFSEAWLGCAPRYKDFLKLYTKALNAGTNPCQIDTNWNVFMALDKTSRVSVLCSLRVWTRCLRLH